MKRLFYLIIPFLAFTVFVSHAQAITYTNAEHKKERVAPLMLELSEEVIKEFEKAWSVSKSGTLRQEGAVLIYRMQGGRYEARAQRVTNQYKEFTFRWHPAIAAIVHTHPNDSVPRPSKIDQQVADKYGVPIFTLTCRGMYVYDPITKKMNKIMDGLDWLESSKWTPGVYLTLTGRSFSDLARWISIGL